MQVYEESQPDCYPSLNKSTQNWDNIPKKKVKIAEPRILILRIIYSSLLRWLILNWVVY